MSQAMRKAKAMPVVPPGALPMNIIKKTFTLGDFAWIKVLLTIAIAPGPGLATVLTGSGPAISPAGCYSPLILSHDTSIPVICQDIPLCIVKTNSSTFR